MRVRLTVRAVATPYALLSSLLSIVVRCVSDYEQVDFIDEMLTLFSSFIMVEATDHSYY